MKQKAIFLHGTGSTGKTSLAKALQECLDEPYLHVGFDLFVPMMPAPYILHGSRASEGLCFKEDANGKPILHIGAVGKNFLSGIAHAIGALAKQGNNIIVDEILIGEKFEEYLNILQICQIFHVGLFAPIEILEKREKERGDRLAGQAQGDFERVHLGKKYDITIDTSQSSPRESAEIIRDYITVNTSS
ncbi:MAG: chloramphenicol phosphotransferase CPT family protein [Candidatus Berkiellales bacterium]